MHSRFPLRLDGVFFTSLQFDRMPELPDPLRIDLSVQLKVHDEDFPDLVQVDLRAETKGEAPLRFCVELIALFRLVPGEPVPDRSIVPDFINERALHILWPNVAQIVKQTTALMGTNPLNIPTPHVFDFRLRGQAEGSADSNRAPE